MMLSGFLFLVTASTLRLEGSHLLSRCLSQTIKLRIGRHLILRL
jgi:hypothetical protein